MRADGYRRSAGLTCKTRSTTFFMSQLWRDRYVQSHLDQRPAQPGCYPRRSTDDAGGLVETIDDDKNQKIPGASKESGGVYSGVVEKFLDPETKADSVCDKVRLTSAKTNLCWA